MNKRRLLAGALSCVLSFSVLSFVSFGNLLAVDDEPQTKTLRMGGEDKVFTYQTEGIDEGWYSNGYYRVLTQDKIIDGKLPSSGKYVLEDNIEISDGVVVTGTLEIDLLGKTITYSNSDTDEYMVTTEYNFVNFFSNVESDPFDNIHGGFVSKFGAPFLDATDVSCNIMNVDIDGGRKGFNSDSKSVFSFYSSGNTLSLISCTITKCASDKGGAIQIGGKSQCSINNCTITNCYANEGGAIYGEGRDISIENSTISSNTAKTNGGAIAIVRDGAVYLDDGTKINYNTCENGLGGGIYVDKTGFTNWYTSVQINGVDPQVINNRGVASGGYIDSNIYFASNEASSFVDISSGAGTSPSFQIGISFFEFYNNVPVQGFGAKNVNEVSIISDNPTLKSYRDSSGSIYFVPKLEQDYFEVKGANLCLDGNYIGVAFHVKVVSGYDGSDLKGFYNAERYSSTPVKADKVEEKDGEWLFTCYMGPMEMSTPITFSVGASYNTSIILAQGFTISNYAKAIYSNPYEYTEYERNVAASLVTFGAATQKYFNFQANNPADYFLSAEDKAFMSEDVTSKDSIYYSTFNSAKPLAMPATENIHYYGASLLLGSTPSLKMYFTYDEGVDTSLIKWGFLDETPTFIPGTRYFYILLTDYEMYYAFNLTAIINVYYGDTCYSFSYAPANYLYNALVSPKATDSLKELANAMFIYNYHVCKNVYGF